VPHDLYQKIAPKQMKTLRVWPNEGALLKISDYIYRMLNIESPSYVLQKVISQKNWVCQYEKRWRVKPILNRR